MQIKKIGAVLASGCALLALSGCESDSKDSGNSELTIVGYQQMQAEYQDSVSKLSWPQGYQPPEQVTGEEENASFQSGYGDSRASLYFECAWEKEWLDSYASDEQRAAEALQHLEEVPEMGYMSPQRADDATRRVFADYLDRAKLGDPSGFQENLKVNCPE